MKKLTVDIGKGGKWELNVSPSKSQIQSELQPGETKTFEVIVGGKYWKLDITKVERETPGGGMKKTKIKSRKKNRSKNTSIRKTLRKNKRVKNS